MRKMRFSSFMLDLSLSRKLRNWSYMALITLMAIIAIVPLFLVFYYVVKLGLPALNWDFFTSLPTPVGQTGGGMANSLLGSGILVGLASLVGIPIGIFGGVYLSEYGRGKIATTMRFCVDLLTSVPSIVIGLYVYTLVVVPFKTFSAYAGGLALAILMFPFIVKTTEEVLKLVPQHIREAGLALGIPRWKVITMIILKGSIPSVMTGIMLGIARIAGETAPLLFTAFGNRFWPQGLAQPTPSLPVQIYSYAISPFDDWHKQAWAGAFLLMMMVFIFNLVARLLLFRDKSGQVS
jgi:phosphate transport system permease protein